MQVFVCLNVAWPSIRANMCKKSKNTCSCFVSDFQSKIMCLFYVYGYVYNFKAASLISFLPSCLSGVFFCLCYVMVEVLSKKRKCKICLSLLLRLHYIHNHHLLYGLNICIVVSIAKCFCLYLAPDTRQFVVTFSIYDSWNVNCEIEWKDILPSVEEHAGVCLHLHTYYFLMCLWDCFLYIPVSGWYPLDL